MIMPNQAARHKNNRGPGPWLLLLLSLVVGLAALGAAGPARANDPLPSEELQSALDLAVRQLLVPGAVAMVRSPDGEIWYGAAGLADLETNQKMRTDLNFHIGSLTKSFTATLFLQLAGQGLVSLDDTIEDLLPGLVSSGSQITMRNLMEMRSGLAHYEQNPEMAKEIETNPRRVWQPSELVAFSDQAVFTPGERFDYNNVNYFIVAMVVEDILGVPYQQAIQEKILDPLGMSNSLAPVSPDMPEPYAHGYLNVDNLAQDHTITWDPSIFWAAGNIISNLDDMQKWFSALMSGSLLTPAMHKEQFSMPRIMTDQTAFYGLGVGYKDGMTGHSGNYNGLYTAAMYQMNGYDFIVLSNGQASRGGGLSEAPKVMERLKDAILDLWD